MPFIRNMFIIGLILSCVLLVRCKEEIRLESIKVGEESISNKNETEITCPKCGFKKTEIMPTEVCQIKYTCTKCKAELFPKKGDCCVFCTYGKHKCPSMQE